MPASRVSLRSQRIRVRVKATRDDDVDHLESEARRGKLARWSREEIEPSGVDRHDPCAFAAATSSTT
jgi:hypothetical protein